MTSPLSLNIDLNLDALTVAVGQRETSAYDLRNDNMVSSSDKVGHWALTFFYVEAVPSKSVDPAVTSPHKSPPANS